MPNFRKRRYGRKSTRKVVGRRFLGKKSQRGMKPNYRTANKVGQVKKIVRSVLARNEETKMQTWDWLLTPLCLQSGTGTLTNNYVVLNPSNATSGGWTINRGTGSGQMVGDKMNLKSCVLKYTITQQPYNATTNPLNGKPLFLRMYFYRSKKTPQNDPTVATICGSGVSANFFDIGTSDIGFSGTVQDLNQRINNDSYRYLGHKTFKLGNAVEPNTTIGVGSPIYAQSNNDFKMCAFGRYNVTKILKKTATRDDGGNWQDDYTFCLFQYVYADGTLAGNVYAPLLLNLHVEYKYTDA